MESENPQSDTSGGELILEEIDYIPKEWPRSLAIELFTYAQIGEYLMEYSKECYAAIKEQVKIHKKEQEEVQDVYKMFSSDETSCNEIYRKIVNIIDE